MYDTIIYNGTEISVGDLVSFADLGNNKTKYGKVIKISELKDSYRVWSVWSYDIEEARNVDLDTRKMLYWASVRRITVIPKNSYTLDDIF